MKKTTTKRKKSSTTEKLAMHFGSILLILLLTIWVAPVFAEDPAQSDLQKNELSTSSFSELEQEIRAYDRQIFLELVKLAEFNVRFQQTVNHCARWRNFVYPLAQEADYACFF